MKIQCPQCKASYRIDDEKIPAQGAKIRCKKCQTAIIVKKEQQSGPANIAAGQVTTPPSGQSAREISSNKKESNEKKSSEISSEITDPRIDEYLKKGDLDAVAKLLLDQVKKSAEQNDFTRAEEVLEKMYAVTPMALKEVVKAGEIIEEAKNKAIDHAHLSMWSALYNLLGTNEVNEVYFAMKKRTLSEGEIVFEQGSKNSNLYFVEEGKLRVSFFDHSKSTITALTDLLPGDIANENSFISFSVTTFTLSAVIKSRVSYLKKSILSKWKEKQPGIEKKLESFLRSKEKISGLIESSGKEPRAHRRFKVALPAMIQLLDESGKPLRMPFKVMIYDISAGGTSYIVKQSQADEAGRLLGNTLVIQAIYGDKDTRRKVARKGKIVAVRMRPFDESSVHIYFKKPLEDEIIKEIEQLANKD